MEKKIFQNRNLTEICNEIEKIIAGSVENSKTIEYNTYMTKFDSAMSKKFEFKEIELLCNTTLKIAKTKNRIIRYIERDIWRELHRIPVRLISNLDFEIAENEELKAGFNYQDKSKNIFSALLLLCYGILEIKDDKSKSSQFRRSGALHLLAEIIDYYDVADCKEIFLKSINSIYPKEQLEALAGLENYYSKTDDEISDELLENIEKIIDETDESAVVSTCLQIQVMAGVIDEVSALFTLKDWEDEHF